MKKIVYALVLLVLCGGMLKAAIPAAERNALIALYNSTNGDAWTDNSNWKTGGVFSPVGTEGTWFGVTVVADHVVRLDFYENNMAGPIPTTLNSLAKLTWFDLANNHLTGSIPTQLGSLLNLGGLALFMNELTGSIPAQLGNLKKLWYLDLFDNQLTGTIPAQLGSLTSLATLHLGFNQLSGTIPVQLGNLANLSYINLEYNKLSGAIPAQLGNLKKLAYLLLRGNQLTGAIPVQLGNLPDLDKLLLYSNKLTGTIPVQLGNLRNLTWLCLDSNQLTGTIPNELGQLTNLEILTLGQNQLTGTIPAELGNLANLNSMSLQNNQLGGAIPAEIGNLVNLQSLSLYNNQLTENIPIELFQLNSLEWLDLGQNQLSGVIPAELGQLSNLEYLFLSQNQLSGSIPAELGQLSNLVYLQLWQNQLTGAIPTQLSNLSMLNTLDLEDNLLSGSIPIELAQLTNLDSLWLDWNQLSGNIPKELGQLTNLVSLALSYNQLIGAIPPEIGNLYNLRYLYLSCCQFSEAIPAEFGNLVNLGRLYLNGNKLGGPIPLTLANLTKLSNNRTDIGYNTLYSKDAGLIAFLNGKDADWASTQTIAPVNVRAWVKSPNSIEVTWSPIAYFDDSGGYNVFYSTTSGGPYTLFGTTATKNAFYMEVSGLTSGVPCYFVVQSGTNPHANNSNLVLSEYSQQVTATCQIGNAPVITVQPANQTILSGQTASLSVTATGDAPLHYQWFQGTSGMITNPVGADASSYTTPALTVTTSYWVRVYNASGLANSNTATVVVSNGSKAPADFNADGVTDLLWRHYSEDGANSIWLMQGVAGASAEAELEMQLDNIPAAAVVGETQMPEVVMEQDVPMESIWGTSPQPGPIPEGGYSAINMLEEVPLPAIADTRWLMCGSGDFNGDGKPDIVWRFNGPGGALAVWLMDGVNRIGVLDLPVESNLIWRIVAISDMDGNGQADIVWQGINEVEKRILVKVWLMDGVTFVREAVLATLNLTESSKLWKVAGCGDFDNDGVQDILWRYYGTGGNVAVWLMSSTLGVRKNIVYLPAVDNAKWEIAGIGDFNRDGKVDVIWRNYATGGANRVWILNGTTYVRLENMPAVTDLTWKIEN